MTYGIWRADWADLSWTVYPNSNSQSTIYYSYSDFNTISSWTEPNRSFGFFDSFDIGTINQEWIPYWGIGSDRSRTTIIPGKTSFEGNINNIKLQAATASKFPTLFSLILGQEYKNGNLYIAGNSIFNPQETVAKNYASGRIPIFNVGIAYRQNNLLPADKPYTFTRYFLGGKVNRASLSMFEGGELNLSLENIIFRNMIHNIQDFSPEYSSQVVNTGISGKEETGRFLFSIAKVVLTEEVGLAEPEPNIGVDPPLSDIANFKYLHGTYYPIIGETLGQVAFALLGANNDVNVNKLKELNSSLSGRTASTAFASGDQGTIENSLTGYFFPGHAFPIKFPLKSPGAIYHKYKVHTAKPLKTISTAVSYGEFEKLCTLNRQNGVILPTTTNTNLSRTYTIKSGDTLYDIALNLGLGTDWYNKLYLPNKTAIGDNPNLIYPNTVLTYTASATTDTECDINANVPVYQDTASSTNTELTFPVTYWPMEKYGAYYPKAEYTVQANTGYQTYTVVSGDYLSTIAPRFGVSWPDLFELNRDVIGDDPNVIQIGMVLKIPGTGTVTSYTYPAETLGEIADALGTTVATLIDLNPTSLAGANASKTFSVNTDKLASATGEVVEGCGAPIKYPVKRSTEGRGRYKVLSTSNLNRHWKRISYSVSYGDPLNLCAINNVTASPTLSCGSYVEVPYNTYITFPVSYWPERYGAYYPKASYTPPGSSVTYPAETLGEIASALGTTVEALVDLNPVALKNATSSTTFTVNTVKNDSYTREIVEGCGKPIRYLIRRTDGNSDYKVTSTSSPLNRTWKRISYSVSYGSPSELSRLNNRGRTPQLAVGDNEQVPANTDLYFPVSYWPDVNLANGIVAPTPSGINTYTGIYVVQSGDTLSGISEKLGLGSSFNDWYNKLYLPNVGVIGANYNLIYPGQVLTYTTSTTVTYATHTVVSGNTLTSIAALYNTTVDALYNLNIDVIGPDKNYLKIGWVLKIPNVSGASNSSGGLNKLPATTQQYTLGRAKSFSLHINNNLEPIYQVASGTQILDEIIEGRQEITLDIEMDVANARDLQLMKFLLNQTKLKPKSGRVKGFGIDIILTASEGLTRTGTYTKRNEITADDYTIKISCGLKPEFEGADTAGRPGVVVQSGSVNANNDFSGYLNGRFRLNVDKVEIYNYAV